MILFCHKCNMAGNWVEDISGMNFVAALIVEGSDFGFGDVVYVGY